jgi:hypothetical protein
VPAAASLPRETSSCAGDGDRRNSNGDRPGIAVPGRCSAVLMPSAPLKSLLCGLSLSKPTSSPFDTLRAHCLDTLRAQSLLLCTDLAYGGSDSGSDGGIKHTGNDVAGVQLIRRHLVRDGVGGRRQHLVRDVSDSAVE